MRARRERAVAHAALKRIGVILAAEGKWAPGCTDLYGTAVEFTRPRPWWRFW